MNSMEKSLFANLKAIILKYRKRFLKGFLFVLLSNLLLLLNPLLFRQALYKLDAKGNFKGELWSLTNYFSDSILLWGAILLTVAFLSTFFKYLMRIAFISISREAESWIREIIFFRIEDQSQEFFDRYGIGELLSRLTNDITRYRDVLGPGLMYPFFGVTLIFPGLIILFFLSWQLALVALIPIIAIPIAYTFFKGRIYSSSEEVLSKYAALSDYAAEHYSNIRLVKSAGIEKRLERVFNKLSYSLIKPSVYLTTIEGTFYPLIASLTRLSPILVLLTAAFFSHFYGVSFKTPDLLSFIWVQSYIYGPVLMLSWVFPFYETGKASYDRLKAIYDEPIKVVDPRHNIKINPDDLYLEIKNLSFTYPGASKKALDDFSLLVKKGEHIGITGPIGSGKSTLFKLISRAYEIDPGKILFSGVDIKDIPLKEIYLNLALCEQIPFLFSKTIAENARFASEDASMEDLEIVFKFADLHETILSFPEQYDTMIGERGITLSGGQKMRLALARAFLLKRPILLFDDIFSSVDATTEEHILSSIKSFFKGRTILLISERISALEKMDRVLYLQEGKIVEQGTPEELKKLNGKYQSLYELNKLDLREE